MKQKVKKVYARNNKKVVSSKLEFAGESQDTSSGEEVQHPLETTNIEEEQQIIPFKNLDHNDILLIGDLVWSKITGHSWWPSMISYDPNTAVYFQKSNRSSAAVKFHVQFFGDDSLRGWVSKSNIIRFQGRDHFTNLPATQLGSSKYVSPNHESSWNHAIIQAEKASQLERRIRKLSCLFNYNHTEKSTKIKKQNSKSKEISIKKTKDKELKVTSIDRRKSERSSQSIVLKQTRQVKESTFTLQKKVEFPAATSLDSGRKIPLTEKNLNYRQVLESNSDSGIEDTDSDLVTDMTSYEIMEPLGSKRKRKQKVYKDYHTGDEIKEAMKLRVFMLEKSQSGGRRSTRNNIRRENIDSSFSSANGDDDGSMKQISEHEKENLITDIQKGVLNETDLSSSRDMDVPSTSAGTRKQLSKPRSKKNLKLRITSNTVLENVERDSYKPSKRKNEISPASSMLKKPKLEITVSTMSISDESSTSNENAHQTNKMTESLDAVEVMKGKRDPKDQYCALCEETKGDLVLCEGSCFNSFHLDCLGLNIKPKNAFVCDECLTGCHSCFSCKDVGNLVKCSQVYCGKFYHLHCVQKIQETRFEGKSGTKFYCPLHACKYCTSNNKSSHNMSNNKKLMKCVRCPTAYHQSTCLVAGCVTISSHSMICDKHFVPDMSKKNHTHVNVTWCFVCSLGGSLVCCDTCPASFHPGCTENLPDIPEGAWQCQDCRDNKKPRYGDVVWVKFGVYRWWPAKICYPDEIPERILNLHHALCEFPVLFFGSRDYTWLHSGRVFKYEEGDKGGTLNGNVSLAKYFKKALEEAEEAYKESVKRRAEEAEVLDKKKSNKPPPFKTIKSNRPVSCVRTILDPSEWPVCECTPEDPCTGESECLNQMLLFECSSKTCPAGDKCHNQRMQKCEYVKSKPVKCEGRGWGLTAEQEIKRGDFVIEYVGELIDEETCHKRIKQYHEQDIYDYYFLTIDRDNIIDAYPKANLSRFMNHSCDPNCETQKWTVNGEVRVGLFANRDIAIGDELCFNYNLDCLGNEKKQCKCGSVNCSGYLGVPPKTQHAMTVAEKALNKKMKEKEKRKMKRQKNKLQKTVHEDDCFICGDGGVLILCSRGKCTKSYHVSCLNLERTPHGKWECPWHYCDECGKLAKAMCALCPNSFCNAHKECELMTLKDGVYVCVGHESKEVTEFLSKSGNEQTVGTADASQDENDDVVKIDHIGGENMKKAGSNKKQKAGVAIESKKDRGKKMKISHGENKEQQKKSKNAVTKIKKSQKKVGKVTTKKSEKKKVSEVKTKKKKDQKKSKNRGKATTKMNDTE